MITIDQLMGVGDGLHAQGDEASLRSGVSRHYYAAYHGCMGWHARLTAPGNAGGGPAGGVHQRLINALKSPSPLCAPEVAKRSKVLGARLQILRDRRKTCDYVLDEDVTVGEAENQREIARNIVAETAHG